jgi:nucleoside-diphosphate-sugar epimerase
MAAQVSYIDSAKIPLDDLDINCKGTLQMLEICRQHNPEVKVVFASSRLVLGKVLTQPVREDHPAEPLSLYGVHKLACEEYFRFYARTYGLKTVVLRITNPYGERQQLKHSKYSLPGWFMRLAMEGKPITIFGDGSQLRDYVYGTDIAEAFVTVGAAEVPSGEIFNCGYGRSVPFREMVETIVEVLGRGEVTYLPWPADYERSETGDVNFDVSKLRRAIGWIPKISLKEGVKQMYEYYLPRLERYI